MFLALPAEHDSNQGSNIVRADFESAVSTGEHGHAKRRLVGHGLNEVSHHAQGVPARAPLGHRIEHGDFRQPELVVFPDSSTESHESVSCAPASNRRGFVNERVIVQPHWLPYLPSESLGDGRFPVRPSSLIPDVTRRRVAPKAGMTKSSEEEAGETLARLFVASQEGEANTRAAA